MGLTKYKMGQLIELVLDTNDKLLYGPDYVRGMTITKEIIPTKADVSGTDLSKFLVVHPGEFIYNPRTHGKRIGFGYNNTNSNFIISWNNIAFKVKKEMITIVLADYLFLHFKRDEWDREACFQSWGSSTEVFSWDILCDMEVEIPSLAVQQKYVDVYNAMVANQKAYERGLEDLKLAKEIFLDKLKLNSPYTSIGKFIKQTDIRNKEFHSYPLKGLSMENYFIDSIAKKEGLDLSNYKIVGPDEFACVLMKVGRDVRLTVALNNSCEYFLISPAYYSFQVSGIDRNYFMAFVSRSEFERRAWFSCDTSARGSLAWEEFINLKIPEPSNYYQKIISNLSLVLLERQEINEKLKEQIKSICPVLIKGAMEEADREGV